MPVYEFECSCGEVLEELTKMGTESVTCPKCGNKAKKIIVKFFDFYDPKGNVLPWVVEAIAQENDDKPFHTKVAPNID